MLQHFFCRDRANALSRRFRKCDYFWWWIFHECFERFFFVFFVSSLELTKTESLLLLIVLWTLECWWEICCSWSIRWATNARTDRRWLIRLHRKAITDQLAGVGVVVALRQCRRELVEDEVAVLCTARTVHSGVLLQWRAVALQERLKWWRRSGM